MNAIILYYSWNISVVMCRIFPNLHAPRTVTHSVVLQQRIISAKKKRDFVIRNGASSQVRPTLPILPLQENEKRTWKSDGFMHGMKQVRRWLSCFVAARIVLNYEECFLNGIIALQRQASALAGYWWYSSEFQRATKQLALTCFIRSGVIGDSRLEKYVSRRIKTKTSQSTPILSTFLNEVMAFWPDTTSCRWLRSQGCLRK